MKVDILAFAAHPDDVEISCSGTLLKHIEMGYKIAIIDLTQGELGTRGTAKTRQNEAANASKILGITERENLKMQDCLGCKHKLAPCNFYGTKSNLNYLYKCPDSNCGIFFWHQDVLKEFDLNDSPETIGDFIYWVMLNRYLRSKFKVNLVVSPGISGFDNNTSKMVSESSCFNTFPSCFKLETFK